MGAVESAARPFDDRAEETQPIQGLPLWSEGFHGSGYDAQEGVGLFVHAARTAFDPKLWDETFVVYLPDGRLLVYRGYGYGEMRQGPAPNLLSYVYTEPFARWEVRFRGAARLVSRAELDAGPVGDDEHVGVEANLEFSALGPPFGIGGMDEEFWARSHYEQHLAITGEVRYEGGTVSVSGTGFRDHSVGPRDVRDLGRHVWCHGAFPSGRLFMSMDVDQREGGRLRYAVVGDQDGVSGATISRPAAGMIAAAGQADDPFEIELEGPDGPSVIRAEIVASLPLSLRGANAWIPGTRGDAHHLMYESMTRFEWDGEVGHGLSERSFDLR